MKSCNSAVVRKKYKEIKRITQKELRTAHGDYIKNMISEDKSNKKLWSYIKIKRQEQVGISDLTDGNTIIKDPKNKANLLNKQFSSVYSNPLPKIEYKPSRHYNCIEMNPINISRQGLLNLLLNIRAQSNRSRRNSWQIAKDMRT